MAVGAPVRLGAPSALQRAAGRLRAGLQQACAPLPDEPGGLLPGLVVGDTSRLPDAVEEDFRATGMTHLNAVSGSNVAIVVGAVLLLARWARAGPVLAVGLCGLALVGFVILVRPSPSVVRAATMGAIGLAALAAGRLGRRCRPRRGGAGAPVSRCPFWPPAVCCCSRRVGGTVCVGGAYRRGWPRRSRCRPPHNSPVRRWSRPDRHGQSGRRAANLLAVPAIAPRRCLAVAAATLSPIWPAGRELLAWLAHWPAWWLVLVARYGAGCGGQACPGRAGCPGRWLLAVLTVALVVAARRPVVRRLVADWVVVDAGPDPAAADACLRRLGVRRVPLLVVSHFHVDHTGGVAGIFRDRRVDTVLVPQWSEPVAGRDLVRGTAATHGTPVVAAPQGWRYRAGAVDLTVLGPPYPMRGTRSDPNNNSLVLIATVDRVRILLTGDAEVEEQRALRERLPPDGLRADVLKVAHHGSAYQDPAFLDVVRPAVALVPVGAGNSYGHPNEAVLARLARGGARVLRTDVGGDVAVVRSPRGLAVVSAGVDRIRPP